MKSWNRSCLLIILFIIHQNGSSYDKEEQTISLQAFALASHRKQRRNGKTSISGAVQFSLLFQRTKKKAHWG